MKKLDRAEAEALYDVWLVVFFALGAAVFWLYFFNFSVSGDERAYYQEIFNSLKIFCIVLGFLSFVLVGRGVFLKKVAIAIFRVAFFILGVFISDLIYLFH